MTDLFEIAENSNPKPIGIINPFVNTGSRVFVINPVNKYEQIKDLVCADGVILISDTYWNKLKKSISKMKTNPCCFYNIEKKFEPSIVNYQFSGFKKFYYLYLTILYPLAYKKNSKRFHFWKFLASSCLRDGKGSIEDKKDLAFLADLIAIYKTLQALPSNEIIPFISGLNRALSCESIYPLVRPSHLVAIDNIQAMTPEKMTFSLTDAEVYSRLYKVVSSWHQYRYESDEMLSCIFMGSKPLDDLF